MLPGQVRPAPVKFLTAVLSAQQKPGQEAAPRPGAPAAGAQPCGGRCAVRPGLQLSPVCFPWMSSVRVATDLRVSAVMSLSSNLMS